MSAKVQLYAFIGVIILLVVLVAWETESAWHRLGLLRRDFNAAQNETFHLAEHVQTKVLALNNMLLRFDTRKDPAEIDGFLKASAQLRSWIDLKKFSVTTSQQVELFGEIRAEFELYAKRMASLLENLKQGKSNPGASLISERAKKETAHVLALAEQLRGAEQKALANFIQDSHEATRILQVHLVSSVVLIIVLGLTAARLTYVAKIGPLSATLSATRSALERHEKLASLGTLAAGVAHEIRNPLTAINIRLHSLKRSLTPDSSQHEDLTVINQEIHRLERIVRDFLQFARPSAPKMETLAAASLFEQVKTLLDPQLDKSRVALKIECLPEVKICADPQQIEQVLINLIQNAAENIDG